VPTQDITPRILFATGGSGGHLYPAIAIAEEVAARWPGAQVLFVTSDRAVERDICTKEGLPHRSLPLLPLAAAKRNPLKFLAATAASYRQSRSLLAEWRPTCVIGTGGWSMTPVIQAARRSKSAIILCEQNVIPGRATRWLARRATTVCTSFDQTSRHLHAARNIRVTGNPIRRAIVESARSNVEQPSTLLVLGGSQGSRALNQAMACAAEECAPVLNGWTVAHQTGSAEVVDELQDTYRRAGIRAEVAPFFSDMPSRYAAARLALSRAGATTLAELACCGVPAVLVPYPHAALDHQAHNAKEFAAIGAARIVTQCPDVAETGRSLRDAISDLVVNCDKREAMAKAIFGLARPAASRAVVDVVAGLIGVGSSPS
jgi:UDP-N-acetylglucosamine--N-acetylmuramyl-(pentapeptide) pyrophosphoryl-undecaprenol N-acetylglucosamine transferase